MRCLGVSRRAAGMSFGRRRRRAPAAHPGLRRSFFVPSVRPSCGLLETGSKPSSEAGASARLLAWTTPPNRGGSPWAHHSEAHTETHNEAHYSWLKADDESKFQGARGSPSDSPAPRVVITWEAVLGTLAPQLRGIVDAVRTSLRRRCFGGSFRACVHIWCTRACVAAAQTQTIAVLAPPTAVVVAGGASVELLQATHSGLAWRLLRKVSSFGLLVLRSAGGWHC